MKSKRIARGFTLVEMMIVILIIGLLAAIVMPNMVKARKQAQAKGCELNERNIGNWLTIYSGQNDNDFPSSSGGLNMLVTTHITGSIPTCPANQAAYGYQVASDNQSGYTVYCTGEHSAILGSNAASGATYPSGACSGCHIPYFNSAGGTVTK